MKSIQTKFISLMVACVLIVSTCICFFGIMKTNRMLESNAEDYLKVVSEQNVQKMNRKIEDVETRVDLMYQNAREMLLDNDATYQKVMYDMMSSVGDNTQWCEATYFLLDSQCETVLSDLVCSKNGKEKLKKLSDKQLQEFIQSDAEKGMRYQTGANSEGGCWIEPYYDTKKNKRIMSYVMPIRMGETVYGVIGMDVDVNMLIELAKEVKVYDTGTMGLLDEKGNIIYHRDYGDGQELTYLVGEEKKFWKTVAKYNEGEVKKSKTTHVLVSPLRNEMLTCLCVPASEVKKPTRDLTRNLTIIVALFTVGVMVLSVFMTKMFLRPLKLVMQKVSEVAKGDYSVDFAVGATDDIGNMAADLQAIENRLYACVQYKEFGETQDKLTKLRNLQSYEKRLSELDAEIKRGDAAFGVVVIDIVALSETNDLLGHDMGDAMIQDAVIPMKKIFGKDNVYRISGGVFVAILDTAELMDYHRMSQLFAREIDKFNTSNDKYERKLMVARGVAVFEKWRDVTYKDVYFRAESLMKQNKKWIREQME